jgi:hypothetical protein
MQQSGLLLNEVTKRYFVSYVTLRTSITSVTDVALPGCAIHAFVDLVVKDLQTSVNIPSIACEKILWIEIIMGRLS